MHENETNTQTQGKEQTRTHTRAVDTDPQFTDRATKVAKGIVERAHDLLNNSADAKVVRRPNQNFF